MLTVGQSHEVSFQVNVMGTSATPEVSVVLSAVPELVFAAKKVGDDWVADLLVPGFIEPGEYDLRVQVLLNNRLFTPVRKTIRVDAGAEFTVTSPVQAETEAIETAEPKSTSIGSLFGDTIRNDDELKRARAETQIRNIMPKMMPRVQTTEAIKARPAEFVGLKAKAAKKQFKPVRTDMPTTVQESQPIRLSMSEIDEAAVSVSELKSSPVKVLKADKMSRVKLIKEALFYE